MKRINKILSAKPAYIITAVYIFFFFFLSSGKELLHNHAPDELEHPDCPVFVISHSFSSGMTIHFELQNELIVESSIQTPQIFHSCQPKPNTSYLRGPPFVLNNTRNY